MAEPDDPPDPDDTKPPRPEPVTSADFFERHAWFTGEAVYHEVLAESAREQAAYALKRAEERRVIEESLRSDATDDTVHDMNVDTQGKREAVRRAEGRATRNHPAQEAFYKAGVTIGEVAKLLGEGRPRVSSWMAEGDDCRPIPRRHVNTLKQKYRIPASAWKRIKD